MAYDTQNHEAFSARMKNWITNLQNVYEEAGKLDDIYTNEAASGADPQFVDNSTATKAEHVDGIVLMRRVRDALALDGQSQTLTAEDQTSRMTPFLQ